MCQNHSKQTALRTYALWMYKVVKSLRNVQYLANKDLIKIMESVGSGVFIKGVAPSIGRSVQNLARREDLRRNNRYFVSCLNIHDAGI